MPTRGGEFSIRSDIGSCVHARLISVFDGVTKRATFCADRGCDGAFASWRLDCTDAAEALPRGRHRFVGLRRVRPNLSRRRLTGPSTDFATRMLWSPCQQPGRSDDRKSSVRENRARSSRSRSRNFWSRRSSQTRAASCGPIEWSNPSSAYCPNGWSRAERYVMRPHPQTGAKSSRLASKLHRLARRTGRHVRKPARAARTQLTVRRA